MIFAKCLRLLTVCGFFWSWGLSPHAIAKTLADIVTPNGSGAEYDVSLAVGAASVQIYFVEPPAKNKKAIEMMFQIKDSLIPIQLWQQFHLSQGSSTLIVENGYLHSDLFQTRKLDAEYLKGFDGVQMNQFLISSEDELKKHFVAKEKLKVLGRETQVSHYRVENAGQTVDFWLDYNTKPIGLVQLVSKGEKSEYNYTLVLTRLLSGTQRKIDPTQAQPMDEITRSFLPAPGSQKIKGLGLF